MSKIAEFGSFAPGELENQSLLVKIKERKKSSNNLNIKFNFPENEDIKLKRKNSSLDMHNNNINIINNSDNISFNNSNNKIFTKEKSRFYNNSTNSSLNHDLGKNKQYSLFTYDKGKLNYPQSHKDNRSPSKFNINIPNNNNYNSNIYNQNISTKKNIKPQKIINLNYSIMEIIISMFCPCCSSSNLETKNKLLQKAKDKLFFGLDILTYLRNLQRTEYLNFILLEPYQNVLIGYMTKPSISLDYQFDVFEHLKNKYNPDFTGKEVDDFLKSYNHLTEIKKKSSVDTRLFNIVNIELENLCIE
jgi:hypothetical protein